MDAQRKTTERFLLNSRYESISPLNHGSFGMVSTAKDHVTGNVVALKCLQKQSAASEHNTNIIVDDLSEELQIHSLIAHHPNIVNLLDSFSTESHSYLVLEYCSMGDLYEAIRQGKGPRETEHVRAFMLQLIDAVETMHAKGIYHRDIKPENIFLTDQGTMKLGDFGLATTDQWSYEVAVGSDRYMAPEQFDPQGNGLAPAQADIWSIGICLLNILFSRNPFGEPAMSDPLFSDFVRDRQSLFDVFSNLSQDTFEVLIHCLAIDPEKRSLSLMRDALQRVISFTTDDDALDDFCTENHRVVTTANREPLRTPSIVSPTIEPNESFPWAQALHMTSPKHQRVLSAIPDGGESYTEDLFPGSENSVHDWDSKADTKSIDSTADSGLGISLRSYGNPKMTSPVARTRPVVIAGSLPSFGGRASQALSSIFGKKKAFESKSWSDMFDEDVEEELEVEHARKNGLSGPQRFASLVQEGEESDGRSTPRPCLAEIKNPSVIGRIHSRASTKSKEDDLVSQHTGFIFEDHTPTQKYSPPSKRAAIADKWSALGERRRGMSIIGKDSPSDSSRRLFKPNTWKRNGGALTPGKTDQRLDHNIWQKKEWNLSTDWRRSDHNLPHQSPLRSLHGTQLDGDASDSSFEDAIEDDGGPEWVGGFKDLHL